MKCSHENLIWKLNIQIEEVGPVQKTRLRQELKKQRIQRKRIRTVFLTVCIAAAAVYIAGVAFYSKHFYARGTVFGIKMMNQSVDSVKEQIAEKMAAYKMDITTRDGQETITADEIDLAYDDRGKLEQLLDEQNPFLWFLMSATSKDDIPVDVALNEEKLTQRVNSLNCMQTENMASPTDAHLEYQEGAFQIIAETLGNELDTDKTQSVIRTAVYDGETGISLDELSCYVAPEIYQDNEKLSQECEEVNKLLTASITYDFSDRTEVVDSDEIAEWITFGDDFTYELDEEKVTEYVHQLGLKYDTFGLSREFKTHSGNTIKLKGGDYGWCINKKKTVAQLIELVKSGETTTTEPVYLYSGVCRDTNDIGDTYIEVSISAQTMWLYKNGECIVSTPVVTGNVSAGHSTPSGGVWAIDARMPNYTLTGQDYNSDVSFWLPFNGDVGIHDASWRNQFGGSIYKTNGSHGCVNTPYSAMKTIYENVKIGYPVVVY